MNILFSNIFGGMIFAGKTYGEMLFSKVSLEQYINYFKSKQIDILCLSEVHLEDKTNSRQVERIVKELGFKDYAFIRLSVSHLDTSKQLGMAINLRMTGV